ncbi:hypothetical protein QJS04_geneDACA002297 [Acorus gramineus]|uniref:Activating molecule in BECN1-regulated autophagy protein 1 n=1 Tax=Acorus gramineus TaxID=55184 RepID=A0AAV9A9C6_ACOGR|nr:hypothetical protein QJS04_geneDACA002297 [Acorus gramineus]
MNQFRADDTKAPTTSTYSSGYQNVLPQKLHSSSKQGSSVTRLLAWREVSPRAKHTSKKLWGGNSRWGVDCHEPRCQVTDAKHALISWVEAESLRHLSAKYCPLVPPPRSTIAAAFSVDGRTLASTHGDHTVKIINCQTGSCLKVLSGHRRTPWVVRFHPLFPEILASGSLDHEVRLWDANTADCIGSRDFYRPIASIAFHAQGEILAVASGHKLYIWNYNRRGETSSPNIVLKTRRSLRAVHFHPHGAPFLLTAEVNDLDCPDTPLTLATSPGYLHYPPPAVIVTSIHSGVQQHGEGRVSLMRSPGMFWPASDGRASLQHHITPSSGTGIQGQDVTYSAPAAMATSSNLVSQNDDLITPMETSSVVPEDNLPVEMDIGLSDSSVEPIETAVVQATDRHQIRSFASTAENPNDSINMPSAIFQSSGAAPPMPVRRSGLVVEAGPSGNTNHSLRNDSGQLHQFLPFGDPSCWDLPFLQGWLMGQSHAGSRPVLPISNTFQGDLSGIRPGGSGVFSSDSLAIHAVSASAAVPSSGNHPRGTGRSASRRRSSSRLMVPSSSGENAGFIYVPNDSNDPQPGVGRIDSDLAALAAAAAAAAELPCTVKLRIWPHDIQDPCATLEAEKCRLTIPHAVLCSEMGAHFSPCGRFLAACVACVLPNMEVDSGLPSQAHLDASGVSTSPTRHPIAAHQIMYELRIYSLEEATFGLVLASRAIRAAHCLTSIQFSPTSEHILLAYGRRHGSLLRSIIVDGESAIPVYTILEIYRVSDMELVRVLPSIEDEVNVACFHPSIGGGVVYGTKEGKLRILQYDGPCSTNCAGSTFSFEENLLEVQQYALEC